MRFDHLLFDFDYTLADSSAGVIDCVRYALNRLDLPPALPAKIRSTIGLSLPETLRQLAGNGHDKLADDFSRHFIERADRVMVDGTVVFPEVADTLDALSRDGASLGIVSTKYRHRIQAILGRDNLLDLFDLIVGGEDVPVHKPDPGGLLAAVERFDVSPTTVLYIGDSATDAETARRAGTPFAAVLTGVTPPDVFHPYRPQGIFADLPALQDWLTN